MIFNKRAIFKLFWPVMMESTLATMVMFISTAMAADISIYTPGAVGLVNSINLLFLSVLMAISTGITVVVAQSVGRNDTKEAVQTAAQSLVALVLFSAVIGALLALFNNGVINLLFGSASPDTLKLAGIYLLYSALSLPLWAVYSGLAGLMRATGNNISPMLASTLGNITLVIAIYFCKSVLGMGIDAIGWGLVVNRLTCAGVLAFLQWRCIGTLPLAKLTLKLKMALLSPVLRIAVPAGLDSFFFNGAKLIVMVFMSGMSDVVLTANTICGNITALLLLPGGAVSTIVVTMVGQAYGAGRYHEARRYMLRMTVLACALQAFMALLTVPLLTTLIGANVDIHTLDGTMILAEARKVLLLFCALSPLLWAPSFVTPNALRGAGDARYTMIASLGSLFVVRLFGSWLLGTALGWGLMGVWVAMMTDWVGRAAFFLPRIWSKKWQKGECLDTAPANN